MLRDLLEMIRFSHTLFALPFALASAILAWRIEPFRWLDLIGILLCMVFARSAAMGFNRIADRHYDAINPRTANRHLPTGRLSVVVVESVVIVCTVGFVAATSLFIISSQNWLPAYLSVPVLCFIGAYSYTKRFTALSHYWLGASLMLAPVAAWLAIRGSIEWPPIVLGLAVLFWVGGFDILYACQDIDFDRRTKLRSIPATLGVKTSLRIAMFSHTIMIGSLAVLGMVADLGMIYFCGAAIAAVLIACQHCLVRPDDLTKLNVAFFHVNSTLSIGLLLFVALDSWM